MRPVLLTVGTTRFDRLLHTALQPEFQTLLKSKGYTNIVVQEGNSQVEWDKVLRTAVLPIIHFSLKPSLSSDIASASLVISHAGAGTCLDVLGAGKPHIVVVNEELMDNHQVELAEKLASEGHLRYCVCDTLEQTLQDFEESELTPFPRGNSTAFENFVDNSMSTFF